MKTLITILVLVINLSPAFSCSCVSIDFCEAANNYEESLVFKGETIKTIYHGNGYSSAVIKVLTILKGHEVLTDTIELFGGNNGASCEVVLDLKVGNINYFAIINSNYTTMDISQFNLFDENNFSKAMNLCEYKKLEVKADFVDGYINKSFDKYPLDQFEKDLFNCSFSIETLRNSLCSNYEAYPNPLKNTLFLRKTGSSELIDGLKIYSTSGKLLYVGQKNELFRRTFNLPNFEERLVILELKCGEERFFQKLVIY